MKKRIWEIDFLRGLLIIAVIFDHFMFDWLDLPILSYNYSIIPDWMKNMHQFAAFYWSHPARVIIRESSLALFFLLSGISCSFSRSNLKRGAKLLVFSIFISIVTIILYYVTKKLSFLQTMDVRIFLGAITCFALCIIIYGSLDILFSKIHTSFGFRKYFFLLSGLIIIIFSLLWGLYPQANLQYLTTWNISNFFQFLFGKLIYGYGDYFGLFPFLGYIFIGGYLGKALYKNKKSLFPKVETNKFLLLMGAVGRKTLWIYILHQAILLPIVALILYLGGARF